MDKGEKQSFVWLWAFRAAFGFWLVLAAEFAQAAMQAFNAGQYLTAFFCFAGATLCVAVAKWQGEWS